MGQEIGRHDNSSIKYFSFTVSKKRKILFFILPDIGGAERISIIISKYLDTHLFELKFIVVAPKVGNITQFIPKEYEVIHLKIRNIWDFTTIRMISLLKKERPYAVFATNMFLNTRVLMAASFVGGIKRIIRNANYLSTLDKITYTLCKLTYSKADVIVAQQEEMKDDIIEHTHVSPEKVIVLHNPLDADTINKKLVDAINPFPQDGCMNYVWVGRISRTKGQDVLINAFNIVYQKNQKTHLYFIGRTEDENYKEELNRLVSEYKLENSVHFVGFDNNPYRWIKYCDCFVLPSRIEGLPNALIEAQYLGKPCVAAVCIPIIDRIINEGENGYKVPSEDYEAMAEAMIKAPKLGNITISYQPTSKEEFIKLFS